MRHALFHWNIQSTLAVLLAVGYPMCSAIAVPTYGYLYSEQVYAAPGFSNTYSSPAAQIPVQATSFVGADSQTGAGTYGVNFAAVRNWLTSDGQNVGLHVTSETQAPHPAGATSGAVYANSDLLYYDTVHFSGTAGQIGRIQVTGTLEGSINSSYNGSGLAEAYLGMYSNLKGKSCPDYGFDSLPLLPYVAGMCYEYDGLIQAIGNGTYRQSYSVTYTVEAGTSAVFGVNLGERNSGQLDTSILDFSNTGFMQFTSLDGLGITTDSGLTYQDAPARSADIPEPPVHALWVGALMAFRMLSKRRCRNSIPCQRPAYL